LLVGLVSLAGMPYAVLMPVFAQEVLHAGPRGLGLLMGASGLGALLGALTLARKREVRGLGRWVARATATLGLGLIAFSMSRHFWLSATLLVPVGFSMLVQTAASNTLIQAMVPDELRGRVMAAYSMMFMGMAPFGALLAGAMAGRIGASGAVALGGVVCLIGAGIFRLHLPGLRVVARQLLVAQEQAGADPMGAASPTGPPAAEPPEVAEAP
jgi:MFS family permease